MAKKTQTIRSSKTLPSSPTHSHSSSSSSSDFEFRISISPRKSSAALCPADQLFYKGQLLPLHLSPRISMVRTLLSSSSTSSTSTTTTTPRDSSSSTDSSTSSTAFSASDLHLLAAGDPDSSRPSSATDDDDPLKRLNPTTTKTKPSSKYFSFTRISKKTDPPKTTTPTPKKLNSSAKEVFRKYLNKVKPLYEKLSQNNKPDIRVPQTGTTTNATTVIPRIKSDPENSTSFSGSLKCPRIIRRSYVASCPSSMRSSPSHSGVLTKGGLPGRVVGSGSDSATMEELQNAIQGAIAHCKNSMLQQNTASFINNSNNGLRCKAKEIG